MWLVVSLEPDLCIPVTSDCTTENEKKLGSGMEMVGPGEQLRHFFIFVLFYLSYNGKILYKCDVTGQC